MIDTYSPLSAIIDIEGPNFPLTFSLTKKISPFYTDEFSKIAEKYPDPVIKSPNLAKFSHILVPTGIEQFSMMVRMEIV